MRDIITKLDYYWNNWVGYRGVSEVILEVQSTVVWKLGKCSLHATCTINSHADEVWLEMINYVLDGAHNLDGLHGLGMCALLVISMNCRVLSLWWNWVYCKTC